jgi:hypothetical protein
MWTQLRNIRTGKAVWIPGTISEITGYLIGPNVRDTKSYPNRFEHHYMDVNFGFRK